MSSQTGTGGSRQLQQALASKDAEIERLRARIEELQEALEHTLGEIDNDAKRNIIPFSAINAWKARRALESDHGDTDG